MDILDLGEESDSIKEDYYDLFHKLLYHINNYLNFQKDSLKEQQVHIFPFPDDLIDCLSKDIEEFEVFFKAKNSE